jgi:hypothetical protein
MVFVVSAGLRALECSRFIKAFSSEVFHIATGTLGNSSYGLIVK